MAPPADRTEAPAWWRTFGDEELNRLVDLAMQTNPGLQQKVAAVERARGMLSQASASRVPQVQLDSGAARNRTVSGTEGVPVAVESTRYSVGIGAAYEVDLWNRIRGQVEGAEAELRASREDARAASVSMAATVAEVWFRLLERGAARELLRRQEQVAADYLELVRLRFERGLAPLTDVYRQEESVAAIRSLLPEVEARVDSLRNELATLTGHLPGTLANRVAEVSLPRLDPLAIETLPGDVILARPDVRAAHHRVVAADRRVASVRAARLPTLKLSGAAQYQSDELATLFDEWGGNLSAAVTLPILDGGLRRAQADSERALAEQAVAAYVEVSLRAFREAADAVRRERAQREYIGEVRRRLELARASLTQERERYTAGTADYLRVLTAQERVHELERAELAAQVQVLVERISVCRAAGGVATLDLPSGDPGEAGRVEASP